MLIEVASAALVVAVGLAEFLISYRWHDRRTKAYRRVRRVLFALFLVRGIAPVCNAVWAIREAARLSTRLRGLQTELSLAREEARRASEAAQAQRAAARAKLEKLEVILTELRNRYPGLSDDEAIQQLWAELSAVRSMAGSDVPRNLHPALEKRYKEFLGSIVKELGFSPGVMAATSSGSRNQQIGLIELTRILEAAGFWLLGPPGTDRPLLSWPTEPLGVYYRPDEQALGETVANALRSLFSAQVRLGLDPDLRKGAVRITIYGEPVFSDLGLIGFR